ncbi:phylloxin-B1-like isoform X2 [Engystomops pustulosus]|uniref:phylloxin-B1-like isoform X2 n=1 Tax=Engystomops pustulosus TaxID=76066 RepID=UPI003AFA715E
MKGSILWFQSSSIQHLLRSRAAMAFLRKSLLLVLFLGLVSLSICEDEREKRGEEEEQEEEREEERDLEAAETQERNVEKRFWKEK